MGDSRAGLVIILMVSLSIPFTATAAKEVSRFVLGGYYKNLLIRSKTLFPAHQAYTLDLNRLRLELKGRVNKHLGFNLQYDNELYLGNGVDTRQFRTLLEAGSAGYVDLDNVYIDRPGVVGRQRLYRAYATLNLQDIQLRIGRQRIAWGTALLWNPMDILNPFNPLQLERRERDGIDALLAGWDYDALSRLSLVYVPATPGTESSTALHWRTNRGVFDYSLMAGRFRGDSVLGFDFAGQLGQIGVRGEFTYSRTHSDGNYLRTVIGGDYTFASTLSLNVEYHYNGPGTTDQNAYDFNRLFSGKLQGLARHYLGGYLGYDLTPLLHWDVYAILNLDDSSHFISPILRYSVTGDLDWSVGLQRFGGSAGSEYRALENLYFTELQWFF